MGQIIVYNTKQEDHTSHPNNFYIGRSRDGNPLGNPFTHDSTKRPSLAKKRLKTRDDAINAFGVYFDDMYGKDNELTRAFDEIYDKYKAGEDVYLQCFCKPLRCHGDIIADRLQRKLIKERMDEARQRNDK